MYDLTKIKNKEVLIRKKMASFVEKICCYYGHNLAHDRFKKVAYNEDFFNTSDEEKAKRIFDSQLYLLLNSRNALTSKIINTFFYIYFGFEVDTNVALRIATKYFDYIDGPTIESATDFHIDVFNEIDCANEEDRTIISLIFFNYVLAKDSIPTIRLLSSDFDAYFKHRDEYLNGNKTNMYEFFVEQVLNDKIQDKKYYQNLKDLTLKDVYKGFKEDEEDLKENFSIKHISIFGSFAKELNRADSDIDLLVNFSLDLTKKQREELLKKFKDKYYRKFNRYVDVSEISQYLNDEFIKSVFYVKKIF